MGYVFMIVAGAILGSLVALMLRTECRRGVALSVGAGVIGALLVGPAVSQGNLATGTYTVEALLISMGGALAAVFTANILH